MKKVLFVCLGNICRSPMAEAIFKKMVDDKGLSDKIKVDSAATGSYNIGNSPHKGTKYILERYGFSHLGIVSRLITENDLKENDYIVCMDDSNVTNVRKVGNIDSNVTLKKLSDFIENSTWSEVPDPYYTGNFDETYELVTEGLFALLEHIEKEL
ncbi:MAG: low molecular weight phosphotyrosine protein phosphatase [Defluviitaleaceae bacterium]|nr:low molecular weight phosphotyrosine protein phosphatase [Defluviitaleaceae bacterium]